MLIFIDPSCIGFWDNVQINRQTWGRQTDRHTPLKTLPARLPSAWVMNV